ncbi:hypothetical protein MOQ_003062 [Trypanosoma cruzi marinkellei]|uniref:Uncharacterized protein n=1 Tax=Trypanosoma cruzi marinkellei TaxID=85056 RepID=K2N0Y4_TRYCR|nr:hypothetical protein MOQ_003062 [Trypanosoma cruzi marinkellei]
MLKLGQASAGTGFAAAPAATAGKSAPSGFGGFGANTATTGGFGGNSTVGFGGFGAAKGFGTAAAIGGQAQVPLYKGIKGPGFSTDWARNVNFSTLRDDVLFEELPPPLQQHLMELHNFIQAEHDAKRFVEGFLTDSMGTSTVDSSSYMELQKKLLQLTAGDNAVDAIRVDCFEREVQGQHLGMLLENCEEEVVQYSKHVWEPLAEQDFTQRLGGNRTELPSEPFQCCLRDVQTRMEEMSAVLTELELAVLPNAQRQKRTTNNDKNTSNTTTTTEPSTSLSHFSRYVAEMKPLDNATGLRSTIASHPVVQMNTTLSNELATLLNLAAWTSRLHARADAARDLFAHLYGSSEAEVLLAQQQRQMPMGPKRPFPLRSADASSFSEPDHDTIGDIHRRSVGLDRLGALSSGERRMQYDVLLERQRQDSAPASIGTNTAGFAASVAPAAAVAATASAAPTVAATTAGTITTTASTAAAGFGASAPPASGTGGTTAFGASLGTSSSTRNANKKGRV